MEKDEIIKYCIENGWSRKRGAIEDDESKWLDMEYERSYADFIYDYLTIWFDEKRIDVNYNDINWGYTNIESYSFTYEEFVDWFEGIKFI